MNDLRRITEEQRISKLLFFGMVVLMLVLLYATYKSISGFQDSVHVIRGQTAKKVALDGVMSALRDQETGVRGYVITSNTSFLEPYRAAKVDHIRCLHDSYELFKNVEDRKDLDSLRASALRLTALWAQRIRSVDLQVERDTLIETLPLLVDKVEMDRTRSIYERISQRLVVQRNAALEIEESVGFAAPAMLIVFSLLAIVATSILFWRLTRSLRDTVVAGKELRANVRDLADEVLTRTQLQGMLQKLLDTSPNGIMSFKALRNEEHIIIDFEYLSSNRVANEMLGRTDLVGKHLLEEMIEHDDNGLFDAYVKVVEENDVFVSEIHYHGSGLNNWYRIHAVKMEDGFVVTFTDITEQRRLQESSVETDRLELTAQITRTVAHEVRNPLTNIYLAIEQLQDEVEADHEDVKHFFQIIERNLERIGTLIKEMLESSRKRELNLIPCKMDDIVNNALKAIKDRLDLKLMKSRIHIDPDLPEVMADCELINLAITNICTNAVEAMDPERGELSFTVTRDPEAVYLAITDNGKGIPPENLERLFEPFYTGRSGGLGLGLTTARSILKSHEVSMSAQSKVGDGSKFTLRFPEKIFVKGT